MPTRRVILDESRFRQRADANVCRQGYAARQRAGIDPTARAIGRALKIGPQHEAATPPIFVVDGRGNAVSNTYTLTSLWCRPGCRGHRRAAQQRARRFHRRTGASTRFGLVGFEANLPDPASAIVVDVAASCSKTENRL